jgi:hypothetical protein
VPEIAGKRYPEKPGQLGRQDEALVVWETEAKPENRVQEMASEYAS